jgi:hypothetical protein
MKRVSDSMVFAWFGTALGAGALGGCNVSKDFPPPGAAAASPAATASATPAGATAKPATPAEPAFVPADMKYQEIPSGPRLVVVGTAKGAEAAMKNGKPTSYVSEIGYGQDGQTVYFENKPEGIERALKAEFARRHGIK